VESADDVLAELSGLPPSAPEAAPAEQVSDDPVLEALGHSPASVDALSVRTGKPASALAAELTRLELAAAWNGCPAGSTATCCTLTPAVRARRPPILAL